MEGPHRNKDAVFWVTSSHKVNMMSEGSSSIGLDAKRCARHRHEDNLYAITGNRRLWVAKKYGEIINSRGGTIQEAMAHMGVMANG